MRWILTRISNEVRKLRERVKQVIRSQRRHLGGGGWGPRKMWHLLYAIHKYVLKKKKKEKKERKEKKRKKRKKRTMNSVKLLHINCCFFQFFNSSVALKNEKKIAPQEKVEMTPLFVRWHIMYYTSWCPAPLGSHGQTRTQQSHYAPPWGLPFQWHRPSDNNARSKRSFLLPNRINKYHIYQKYSTLHIILRFCEWHVFMEKLSKLFRMWLYNPFVPSVPETWELKLAAWNCKKTQALIG